jgi:hypothetical protein
VPWEPAQRSGSKICLEKFAQVGKPAHATPVALSRETRKGALAQLFAKSKIQNGISYFCHTVIVELKILVGYLCRLKETFFDTDIFSFSTKGLYS